MIDSTDILLGVSGISCEDCGSQVSHVAIDERYPAPAFCGIGCYGRWFIRERFFAEEEENENENHDDIHRDNLQSFLEKKTDTLL